MQQVQMNLASEHQKHKTDVLKLEEQACGLEHELANSTKRGRTLEQDMARQGDTITRLENDHKVLREDIGNKVDEVCHCLLATK